MCVVVHVCSRICVFIYVCMRACVCTLALGNVVWILSCLICHGASVRQETGLVDYYVNVVPGEWGEGSDQRREHVPEHVHAGLGRAAGSRGVREFTETLR